MVFFKKKDKKVETFVDGKKQGVPDKVPELEVPKPEGFQKSETTQPQQLSAQEVYDEGRNVGFQEGMIECLRIISENDPTTKTISARLKMFQDGLEKVKR
jgi:hypothetical protein